MDKTVRLRVRKELEKAQERKIISLKGSLISGGYTDIIHIDDEDEQYHINFFSTERKAEALMLIRILSKKMLLQLLLNYNSLKRRQPQAAFFRMGINVYN